MNAYKNFFKRLHIEFGDKRQFYAVIYFDNLLG